MYYSYIVLLAIAKTAWVSSTPSLTGDIESTLIHLRQIAGLFQHVHTAGNSQWTKTLRTDKQKINNCRTRWDWDPVFLLAVATASGLCLDESFFMGLHQAGVKLSDHQQKPFAFLIPVSTWYSCFPQDFESTRLWVLFELKHRVIPHSAGTSHDRGTTSKLQPCLGVLPCPPPT